MTKRILLALILLSFLSSPALAGFEEGKNAYNKKDWATAISELRPLAESGDDRAMLILGNMYYSGLGVVQNYNEAISLYKRAATTKNNPEAMTAVAALYTSGFGITKNLNMAMLWFQRAALLGEQQGAFLYATILLRGNKSPTDDIQPDFYNAYKWFKIVAAERQYPQLQKNADEIAKRVAEQKLTPDQVAKADKEASEWKPVDAASLGPFPEDSAGQDDKKPEQKNP